MDANKLKRLLEKTQREFPPHYPEKRHGITNEIEVLCNNLNKIINYIGFSNANIAIKNIVSKMINEFLISTFEKAATMPVKKYCDFELIDKKDENGREISISYQNRSLEFKYTDNGFITITNNSIISFTHSGEDYSNSTISYDTTKPDELYLVQTFDNNSILHSKMLFNEVGIEMNKEFKIIPKTSYFTPTEDQCIIGYVIRNEDFYTATYGLQAIGNDFGKVLRDDDIKEMNSIPSRTVPFRYICGEDFDLNLLCVVGRDGRESRRTGAIQDLVYRYNTVDGYEDSIERDYKKSKQLVENNVYLEIADGSFLIGAGRIDSPYDFEILKNIKEYVKRHNETK